MAPAKRIMFKPLLLLLSLLLALSRVQALEAAPGDVADSGLPASQAAEKTSLIGTQPPLREGESIWLEKKLAPSTRWIERLIRPLNRWMEQKVQAVKPAASKALAAAVQHSNSGTALLSEQQISAIAQQRTPGKVLAIKLLPAEHQAQRYRLKLLSRQGVIHILYLDAQSGASVVNQLSPGL